MRSALILVAMRSGIHCLLARSAFTIPVRPRMVSLSCSVVRSQVTIRSTLPGSRTVTTW